MGSLPQKSALVTLPENYLPTVSETNAFVDGDFRVWDLTQTWATDQSHAALRRTGSTYRQALYLDIDAGTYYTTTNTLLGYPLLDSYISTLPGAYLGLREDYEPGLEFAVGVLYAAQIQTGITYRTQMVIASGTAITDTGILLSSNGLRLCDSVLCVSWSDHYIVNPIGNMITLPGPDRVELHFSHIFLPTIYTLLAQ